MGENRVCLWAVPDRPQAFARDPDRVFEGTLCREGYHEFYWEGPDELRPPHGLLCSCGRYKVRVLTVEVPVLTGRGGRLTVGSRVDYIFAWE